jgi:molybdopterin-containing oxidoreductase family iron-sulfur binding subunit
MSESPSPSRRSFLGAIAAFSATTLAPGIILYARSPSEPVTNAVRWGILVDAGQCNSGCNACVTACNTEFGLVSHGRPESDPQWIRKVTMTDPDTGRALSFPVMCQHCALPPCVDVCPTGASFKRADGIVLVNRHICVGCRYCMMACPYKARNFVHEAVTNQKPYAPRGKGTVEACTMCVHRVDAGGTPACVEACRETGRVALLFGNLNDPNSEIAKRVAAVSTTQIRSDLRTDPAVRYQGL